MLCFRISFASKVAIIYILTGGLYILFSDRLLTFFSSDPVFITDLQSIKGWGFIFTTGLILYLLLRRQERTRSQAQDDYQNIVEHAVEGIFQSTPAGRFARLNQAMAKIYGYDTPEQMIEEISDISSQIYVNADEREKFTELILRDGVVEGFIGHNRRRDGSIIWTSTTGRAVKDAQGNVRLFEGFIQDISKQKRAEEALLAAYQIARAAISTRTLDELFEFIHSTLAGILPAENFYIALYDPASDLLTFSYFVDLVDEPSEPIHPGRGLTEYVLRTEKPLLASPEVFEDLLTRGEVEKVGVDSIDWLGVPLRIDDRTIGVMVVQSYVEGTRYSEAERDILSFVSFQVAMAIERKRAESALVDSEQRFRRLVEFSPQPIAVHRDGVILYANPSLMKMIRATSSQDVVGKRVLDFIHPDFRPIVVQRIQEASAQAVPLPLQEEKFIRLDGALIDVEVVSMGLIYDGKPAIQSIIQDITERKQAHSALQRQLKEMTVLNAVAAVATKATQLDDLIAQATQVISDMLYPDNCGIILVNPLKRVWQLHPSYRGVSAEKMNQQYPFEVGISGKAAETGEILKIGDIRNYPQYMEGTPGILSELSVPILLNGAVYGLVNAESRQLDAFSEQDERLLTIIADSLGTAVEKIRLLNTEKERLRESEILRAASIALTGPLDLKSRLETILDYLAMIVPYDSASIALGDQDELEIVCGRGLPEGYNLIGKRFRHTDKKVTPITMQKPLIFADAWLESDFERWEGTDYIRGWIGVPLVAYHRVIGFISLDSRTVGAFSEHQGELALTFANQAAMAIENARLYEAEQRRRMENARLLDDLQLSNLELSLAYDFTLEGWGRALEMRDKETHGHTRRVTELTLELARKMKIPESQTTAIRRGVLLHDIGKMGVSDAILRKPGPLSPEEWIEMRKHPQYAYDLIYPIAYLRSSIDIPYCHHEKWDGSGYPRGLKGEEIPLVARIFSVIDVWDAVTHDRTYLNAWSQEEAIAYIRSESGAFFDPKVVEAFLEMIEESSA